MTMVQRFTLTLAVCSWRRGERLRRLLQSVARDFNVGAPVHGDPATPAPGAAPPPPAWEVLVVDSDRTGVTCALAAELAEGLPIRYVFEPARGSSAARNRALDEAGADLVVFVDDDVTIAPGFLASYAAAASTHPDVAFFGGPVEIHFERGEPAWLPADPARVADMFGQLVVDPEQLAIGPDRVPSGANFAVRRSRARGERFDGALAAEVRVKGVPEALGNPARGARGNGAANLHGVSATLNGANVGGAPVNGADLPLLRRLLPARQNGAHESPRVNGDEIPFLKRLLGAGLAGRWLPGAAVHRWIPPEQTTVGQVVRHLAGAGRAQVDLRACDDEGVLGESAGAVVLRVQHAAADLALRSPPLFSQLRRASHVLAELPWSKRRPRAPMDFVVGHPRSGTGLMTHVLNAAGPGVAEHEYLVDRTLLGTLIEAATAYYQGQLSGEEITALLRAARLDPSVRIDSSWKNVWILPPLLELYPDARFLHITRDPRQNVIACHNLDYYGEAGRRPEFSGYPMSRWLRAMPRIRVADWNALSPFERNCAFWVETHRLILDTLSARPGRYLRLRLEDLRDDAVARVVYRFFDLPVPPAVEIGRAVATPANPKSIDKHLVAQKKRDILPRFEACPAEVRETLRRMCGPTAERLGYRIHP